MTRFYLIAIPLIEYFTILLLIIKSVIFSPLFKVGVPGLNRIIDKPSSVEYYNHFIMKTPGKCLERFSQN